MPKGRRWTEEDLGKTQVGKKRSKGRYGNVRKPVHDGIRFDSKRELNRYMELKLLEKAGEIRFLEVHPKFPITIGGVPIMVSSNQHNKWDRHLTYEADFKYDRKDGCWWPIVIEDVKMQSGHRTGIYKLKRALMRAMGYDITEY
jgi:hypothetical protein